MKKNSVEKSLKKNKKNVKIDDFINDVKKGKYSKESINDSLRINTSYVINSNNPLYIFGVK